MTTQETEQLAVRHRGGLMWTGPAHLDQTMDVTVFYRSKREEMDDDSFHQMH